MSHPILFICCLALVAPLCAQEATRPAASHAPTPKKTPGAVAKKPAKVSADESGSSAAGKTQKSPAAGSSRKNMRLSEPSAHKSVQTAGAQSSSAEKPVPSAKAQAKRQGAAAKAAGARGTKATDEQVAFEPTKVAELKARLEETLKLPAWERIAELQDFLDEDLPDALADRATEHLVSAEAAYGDERLQAGDIERGVRLLKDAVADAPREMSDKLYFEVVSQLPANLYLRGQSAAAFEAAHAIEKKARDDAKRLLALVPFYLSVEQADEAARLAEAAARLAPDLSAAHQALGAARRLQFRLDEAASAYARALELDPKSAPVRRSLADLKRANGKAEEAVALYRELLTADAADRAARTGFVLALFDAGRREEAERELDAALRDDPRNLQLLAGAAYSYAARGDYKRALELAGRAVEIEPRHSWAQVALARALVASNQPLDAELALRFARLNARFPTLDYELANTLAAAGLYEEAAEELARGFTVKGAQVETRLGGRVSASSANFIELLAPERRASLFQPNAADTEENARMLKALLALHLALKSADPTAVPDPAAEAAAVAAALEFARGDDAMHSFRQLYAASRLLRRGVGARAALELAEAAKSGVEAALDVPQATVAATADELRDARALAIEQGATPDIPALPRNILSNIVRGRIEELAGWALLRQGRAVEAGAALRRAVAVFPVGSLYWRSALWRLGSALAANNQPSDALGAYVKAYDPNAPDAARLAVIESLYRKLNGSLAGLDLLIGRANAPAQSAVAAAPTASATVQSVIPAVGAVLNSTQPQSLAAPPADTTMPAKPPAETAIESKVAEPKTVEPEAKAAESKIAAPVASRSTPPEAKTGNLGPTAKGAPRPSGEPARAQPTGSRRASSCPLAVSEEAITLAGSGGSASILVRLEGQEDLSKVTATTPDWSNIIVLREPPSATEAGTAKFTVNSISKARGNFTVTIKSPCGAKDVAVTVK